MVPSLSPLGAQGPHGTERARPGGYEILPREPGILPIARVRAVLTTRLGIRPNLD